jgi:DNA-binding ferritin-like protein
MCSKTDERLALIGTAIDELAEAVRAAAGAAGAGPSDTTAQDTTSHDTMTHDAMAERVARIWAMVADLDPALAHRLSQYTGRA